MHATESIVESMPRNRGVFSTHMYTLLIAAVALWLIFTWRHGRGSASPLVRFFGAALLVAAFCAPRLLAQASRPASVLRDALTSLSEADLRKYPKSSNLR